MTEDLQEHITAFRQLEADIQNSRNKAGQYVAQLHENEAVLKVRAPVRSSHARVSVLRCSGSERWRCLVVRSPLSPYDVIRPPFATVAVLSPPTRYEPHTRSFKCWRTARTSSSSSAR